MVPDMRCGLIVRRGPLRPPWRPQLEPLGVEAALELRGVGSFFAGAAAFFGLATAAALGPSCFC